MAIRVDSPFYDRKRDSYPPPDLKNPFSTQKSIKPTNIRILTSTEIPRLEQEIQEYKDDGWVLDGNLIVFYDHKLQRTKYIHVMIKDPHLWRYN